MAAGWGAALWLLSPVLAGRAEPWDVSIAGYLLTIAIGGGAAMVCPQRFWLAPAGLVFGQAMAVWLLDPQDVLRMLGVTCTAALVAAPAVVTSGLVGLVFRRRDHPRPPWACAGCGYDLRGIGGERCPECGTAQAVRRPRAGS